MRELEKAISAKDQQILKLEQELVSVQIQQERQNSSSVRAYDFELQIKQKDSLIQSLQRQIKESPPLEVRQQYQYSTQIIQEKDKQIEALQRQIQNFNDSLDTISQKDKQIIQLNQIINDQE